MVFDSQPLPRFKYSPAVCMGPFVKTAGMVGLEPETGALAAGGAKAEFEQILRNLKGLMADNGIEMSQLMSATLYVSAFHRFPQINEVWDAFFEKASALPARTAVGVSQLPIGAQVEAEFLFYVEDAPNSKQPAKEVSHA